MLSIVMPAFNEELNIERTVRETKAWLETKKEPWEIVVVNDGSRDGTGGVLETLAREIPELNIVTHEKNRGYGAAVGSGCDAAKGDVIGYMDSDGQFKAKDFDLLLPKLSEASFITGRRRKRADPFIRKLNAKLFGLLSWVVLGIWVRDINCAMKVFTKEVWKQTRPTHSTGALINAEMFTRAQKAGIPWIVVDVPHAKREFGTQTGANLGVILRMFRELWALKNVQ
ncbi:glycosyltransferase family 2 protein [Candidatus Peribacteria bacterium]|nr:glycosyltransferase family 2 protein [Candidatus Peribacteria bacterium]